MIIIPINCILSKKSGLFLVFYTNFRNAASELHFQGTKITKKYNDISLNSRYRFKSILEKYKNESLELFFESSVHKFSRNTISDFISILNSKHLSNNINDDIKNRILYIFSENPSLIL